MTMDGHISDRDLLLELDGELEMGQAEAVRAHLELCAECRERSAAMERASEDFAVVSEAVPVAIQVRKAARQRKWIPGIAAAAVAIAVARILLVTPARDASAPLPDTALTPGATVAVNAETLCASPEPEAPMSDASVASAVFARYGVAPAPRAYELDFLITPALGGSSDASNLWPQPYRAGEWNSRVKDALEDRLRQLVCAGKLDLAAAQRELASNWVAAYQRRFGTARPLSEHAAFVKDRAWE